MCRKQPRLRTDSTVPEICCSGWIKCPKLPCSSGIYLIWSLAVLDLRVIHTMDVLSPFIPVLCHSDWPFHGESSPRLDVVHPGPCVAFLACVHLALFLALSLSPGSQLETSKSQNRDRQRETDIHRQRLAERETDIDRQRSAKTETDIQRQRLAERERDIQRERSAERPGTRTAGSGCLSDTQRRQSPAWRESLCRPAGQYSLSSQQQHRSHEPPSHPYTPTTTGHSVIIYLYSSA